MKTTGNFSTTGKDGSWTALKNVSGATGYQLWRATSPNGTYKRIQVSRTTTAKDTTSKKGKTYYYKDQGISESQQQICIQQMHRY